MTGNAMWCVVSNTLTANLAVVNPGTMTKACLAAALDVPSGCQTAVQPPSTTSTCPVT
jgi:hypothetical protein